MKLFFFTIISSLSYNCFSQSVTFSADTTRISRYFIQGKYTERISSIQWIIQGQTLKFGDQPISVEVTPHQLDTIYFKGYLKKDFDTLICDIQNSGAFVFYYNECCGAFNIYNKSEQKFIEGSINFKIINQIPTNEYLGIIGEAGIIIGLSDTLGSYCRSAMSPNVYPVKLSQIQSCIDSLNCEGICLYSKPDELLWGYSYQEIENLLEILYLPLSSSPLLIEFDPKSKIIFINKKQLNRKK